MAQVTAVDINDVRTITGGGVNMVTGVTDFVNNSNSFKPGKGVTPIDITSQDLSMDDAGTSNKFNKNKLRKDEILRLDDNGYLVGLDLIKKANNLRSRSDIDLFNKYYRFGVFNPYETVGTTKEFLFFTKPDLFIMDQSVSDYFASTTLLRPQLRSIPYWKDLLARMPEVIYNLQNSCNVPNKNPFIHLLANTVTNTLEVPSISAETTDTPTNMYGVNFSYRGSSEASNDSFDFSLEFLDTKYLPVYTFFKAYEEYEILKHHGLIGPHINHIQNKILHDQIAVYKFIVDDDMETIIYYAKYTGVMPVSVSRDSFSSVDFSDGIKINVGFKAAFFEDSDPLILSDFNSLGNSAYQAANYRVDIYNDTSGRVDFRPTTCAHVEAQKSDYAPGGYNFKLRWRGRDTE